VPQRPVRRIVGAAVCSGALAACAGCAGASEPSPAPSPTGTVATACAALVAALPDRVADQRRTSTGGDTTASWGDPAIVLRCGVDRPEGFDEVSVCTVVDGVGWFVPEQAPPSGEDLVATVVDRSAYVELRLPQRYLPPATAMVDLAPAVKATLHRTGRCQ
jgi:hypothetical protein